MNEELKQQFFELYTTLSVGKKYLDTIAYHETKAKDFEKVSIEEKNKKYHTRPRILVSIGVCFSIFLIFFSMAVEALTNGSTGGFIVLLLLSLVPLALMAILPLRIKAIYKEKNEKLKEESQAFYNQGMQNAREHTEIAEKIRKEYNQFANKYLYTFDFLPAQYHSVDAITHMYNIVSAGRADTLKETINLYEQEVQMLRLQNQLTYQQQRMNQYMQQVYEQQAKTNKILSDMEFLQIYDYLDRH